MYSFYTYRNWEIISTGFTYAVWCDDKLIRFETEEETKAFIDKMLDE